MKGTTRCSTADEHPWLRRGAPLCDPVSPRVVAHCGQDRAREEQADETVLDCVEAHEGQDDCEGEQKQRAQDSVPQPSLDRLAKPNHAPIGLEGAAGGPSARSKRHEPGRTR